MESALFGSVILILNHQLLRPHGGPCSTVTPTLPTTVGFPAWPSLLDPWSPFPRAGLWLLSLVHSTPSFSCARHRSRCPGFSKEQKGCSPRRSGSWGVGGQACRGGGKPRGGRVSKEGWMGKLTRVETCLESGGREGRALLLGGVQLGCPGPYWKACLCSGGSSERV